MIPAPLLTRLLTLPAWLKWAIGGVVVVVLIAIGWNLWLSSHDAEVIGKHEAGIASDVANATNAANDTANTNDAQRQADNAAASQHTKDGMAHAEEKDPECAKAAAGPVARSAVDSVRRRAAKTGAASD